MKNMDILSHVTQMDSRSQKKVSLSHKLPGAASGTRMRRALTSAGLAAIVGVAYLSGLCAVFVTPVSPLVASALGTYKQPDTSDDPVGFKEFERQSAVELQQAAEGKTGYECARGRLQLPEGVTPIKVPQMLPEYHFNPVTREKGTYFAKWVKYSNEFPLFLHRPVVHDMQQYALNNCQIIACLISLLNTSSGADYILDSMRDLGDGRVIVQLFDDLEAPPTPVYYIVEKSVPLAGEFSIVNKTPGCIWVDMLYKAFLHHYTLRYAKLGHHALFQFDVMPMVEDFIYALLNRQRDIARTRNLVPHRELMGPIASARDDAIFFATPKGHSCAYEGIKSALDGDAFLLTGTGGHSYAVVGTSERDGKSYIHTINPLRKIRKNGDMDFSWKGLEIFEVQDFFKTFPHNAVCGFWLAS